MLIEISQRKGDDSLENKNSFEKIVESNVKVRAAAEEMLKISNKLQLTVKEFERACDLVKNIGYLSLSSNFSEK